MRESVDSNFIDLQAMLLARLAESPNLSQAQQLLVEDLVRRSGAGLGALYRLDRTRGIAQPACHHGDVAPPPQPWPLDGAEATGFLNAVVVAPKAGVRMLDKASAEAANLAFGADAEGQPIWLLRLEWAKASPRREQDMKYYRKICQPVAPTLKLLEDKEASERLAKDLAELQETTTAIDDELDDLDLDRLLAKFVKIVKGQTDARHICVLVADPAGLTLRSRAHLGDLLLDEAGLPRTLKRRGKANEPGSERRKRPGATGTFFAAFDAKKTYLSNDVETDGHYTPLFRGTRSSLAVPLLVGNHALGVLLVESDAKDAFSGDEIRMVESLARTVAVYVAKARAYAETETDDSGRPLELLGQPRHVIENASVAATSDAPVLIEGESGTGKGVLAKYIHRMSARRDEPFVVLNCGTLSDSLLLSQLFGHVKGAFTGADQNADGALATANRGTLFLDDAEVLSKDAQARFLQVLETGTFHPVGSAAPRRVNVRVVAATNIPLEELVKKGQFREDLYYRLAVLVIRTSPLRMIKRSLPRLIEHKMRSVARRERKPAPSVTSEAMALLRRYPWPGNYREMENVLRSVIVKDADGLIDIADLPPQLRALARAEDRSLPDSFREANLQFEKNYLVRLLKEVNGNISAAAKRSGLSRAHLYRLLEKHGIRVKDEEKEEEKGG